MAFWNIFSGKRQRQDNGTTSGTQIGSRVVDNLKGVIKSDRVLGFWGGRDCQKNNPNIKCLAPEVTPFFDPVTKTASFVVADPQSDACAIIDPVLDLDMKSASTSTESADKIIDFVKKAGLQVQWILETHVHADHLTAAMYLKRKLGGTVAVGDQIEHVQTTWNDIFKYKEGFETDPSMFDHLFADGEEFMIGNLFGYVMYTPGHTSVDITYVIGDAVFVGDTFFMPDYGTARTDFPGGSARDLYHSLQKILELPDEMRVFVGHDYLPAGRNEHQWETTIAAQKNNVFFKGLSEEEFIKERESRDANLQVPMLLYPSLQFNIRAGKLPPSRGNTSFLQIPLKPGHCD